MTKIDPALLLSPMALDTDILILAFGHRPKDSRSRICEALFGAMVNTKREILVCAASFAEFLHGWRGGGPPPSLLAHVFVAPFDMDAARLLGSSYPMSILKGIQAESKSPRPYYKFDAMIVATAERFGAKCIVTYDDGMKKLARERNLRCEEPSAFLEKQLSLEMTPDSDK